MIQQTLLYIFLKAESGGEAIAGGVVMGIAMVVIGAILSGIKKRTAKKKDAKKIK